jgi:DNA-binding response OmpR family regulator
VVKTVLVVVRDRELGELLAQTFVDHGFRARSASDVVSGLFQFGLVQPDLVVLDTNGTDVLKRLRALSNVPIIVLVEDDPRIGIESLNQGADYYVTEPPNLMELLAKARALFRRDATLYANAVVVDG